MSDALVKVRVDADGAADDAPGAWADGLTVALPASLGVGIPANSEGIPIIALGAIDVRGRSLDAAIGDLRNRALFTDKIPISNHLPFSYQRLPQWIRTAVGHRLGRSNRHKLSSPSSYPSWPLDLSTDFLQDIASGAASRKDPTPVLLTHDIDTAEGLRILVRDFLAIEEAVGARSANYVVPCGWKLDHGLLNEIVARGHEIGVHGYDHSNATPYMSHAVLESRLERGHFQLMRYQPQGYRAPSLVRTKRLMEGLSKRYLYDTSVPTSGGLFPVINNGCASARPFHLNGLREIPLSLPRDGSLCFLGYTPPQILELWFSCAATIAKSGGVVNLLTHCERRFTGNAPMMSMYRRFVETMSSDKRFAWSTPLGVANELQVSSEPPGN